jgi:hypothetical protein
MWRFSGRIGMLVMNKIYTVHVGEPFLDKLINPTPSNVFFGKINFSWDFLGKYKTWGEIDGKCVRILDEKAFMPKVHIIDDDPLCWFYINIGCLVEAKNLKCNCKTDALMYQGCKCGGFQSEKTYTT